MRGNHLFWLLTAASFPILGDSFPNQIERLPPCFAVPRLPGTPRHGLTIRMCKLKQLAATMNAKRSKSSGGDGRKEQSAEQEVDEMWVQAMSPSAETAKQARSVVSDRRAILRMRLDMGKEPSWRAFGAETRGCVKTLLFVLD